MVIYLDDIKNIMIVILMIYIENTLEDLAENLSATSINHQPIWAAEKHLRISP